MKKTILFGIISALIIILFAAGCQPQPPPDITISPEVNETEINPITGEPYHDIIEKRGLKTNITEFDELLVRASSILSYKYNITDTELGIDNKRFYVRGRFIKSQLPEPMQHETGEIFDEVLLDRITRTAFSHCSKNECPKPNLDKEVEKVDYDEYYNKDPVEYLYRATQPNYINEDMIGDQYVKVFSVTFEGKPARIWLQEYYGFPLKIIVRNEDDTKRTIKFEDMMVDNVRRGEIDLPFNFTVKGEEGNWIFWEHYLGEWPEQGVKIDAKTGQPILSV